MGLLKVSQLAEAEYGVGQIRPMLFLTASLSSGDNHEETGESGYFPRATSSPTQNFISYMLFQPPPHI